MSGRVSEGDAAWLREYAKRRGTTAAKLVAAAVLEFRSACEGGVPDLPPGPVAETPARARTVGETPPQRRLSNLPPGVSRGMPADRQARLNKELGWS